MMLKQKYLANVEQQMNRAMGLPPKYLGED